MSSLHATILSKSRAKDDSQVVGAKEILGNLKDTIQVG